MNELFGVPMSSIMTVLVILLGLCLLVIGWVAWRRRVVFKMGLRNIPRRRAQTVLVVIGLMLSTLIIAAAFGTGDTIDHSATAQTYETLGDADELVVYSRQDDGEGSINSALNERIPQSTVQEIEAAFEGSDLIDGLMPILIETVPAVLIEGDPPAQGADLLALFSEDRVAQAEPISYLVGIDPARLSEFGGLESVDGQEISFDDLADDEVIISEQMAEDLGAGVGDTVGVSYGNEGFFLTVAAIAVDSPLSGRIDTETPGMVVPLDRLQVRTKQDGQVTAVAVSNRGDLRDGMDLTDQVTDQLRGIFQGQSIGVDPIKQDSIDEANTFASIFTTFFLVFGLFSIAVGILLIVLIFTMLAAERRSEMGMARAVGAQRLQLVQQFMSEGTAYALAAGLVGAALGIGAAVAIALALKPLFGDFVDIEPYVTPRSLIVAYCLGVIITFIAVVASSWRISRLNIVAAVRDIPDVSSPTRKRRTLVWAVILIVLGGLIALLGQSATNAFSFYLGMSLLPFGIARLLRYFGVPSRPVYTLVGVYLLVIWLLPPDASEALFGDLGGDIEMFFLSGIFMVAGATIVIVQNLDWILAALDASSAKRPSGRLFARMVLALLNSLFRLVLHNRWFRSNLPAIRTGLAFPGADKGRTGMMVAMFSLIVFSLVTFATINENFVNLFLGDEANAGWDIRADQGRANPIGDTTAFRDLLEQRGVDTSNFEAIGQTTTNVQVNIRRPGMDEWKQYLVHGADNGFLTESEITFQQRATGYDDDAAILEALRTEPNVAIIDQGALETAGGFGEDESQFRLEDPDGDGPQQELTSDDETFDPVAVEIEAADGSVQTLNIIGVIDAEVGSLFGLYARQDVVAPILGTPSSTSYFVRVSDPGNAEDQAMAVERALLINGAEATSIRDELEDFQQQNQVFLYIIQGFMGLGLIVGIAAVGVISFRNVVERRQQIGVLRAIGYQRSMVSLSFLIETGFIVALGVLSGTALGVILARNLFADDEFAPEGVDFTIPWGIIAAILVVTVVAALLMTVVPSRQASRIAPAEALRFE